MTNSDNGENNKTQEEISSFNSVTDITIETLWVYQRKRLIWKKCRVFFAILGILFLLSLQ